MCITFVEAVPAHKEDQLHYCNIQAPHNLEESTVFPQITAQAFISFQQFFTQGIKRDRHLLVEDLHTVYNL